MTNNILISNLLCRDEINRKYNKQALRKYKQLVKEYNSTNNGPLINNQLITFKYRICNYLGFKDKIPNGYFDIGRVNPDSQYNEKYIFESNINYYIKYNDISINTREIILVDNELDIPLQHYKSDLETYKEQIYNKFSDIYDRKYNMYLIILKYVDAVMTNKSTDRTSKVELFNLMTTIKINIVPIGFIKIGVCRHKSLLYKILCDHFQLECMLIRGILKSKRGKILGSHAWNIVQIKGRAFIVDVRNHPGKLLEPDKEPNKDVYNDIHWRDLYKREGKDFGNIGDSLI